MTNPSETPDAECLVLINDERQYSLWPAFVEVPAGWVAVHDRDTRDSCLNYINEHWTDMRPKILDTREGRA